MDREKSVVAKMQEVPFLVFRIYRHKIQVNKESLERFKGRVKELTHRNNPLSMYQAIRELNVYLREWAEYFQIQEFKQIFGMMDRWIRCRLRSMQLAKWKEPRKFQRVMISRGFPAKKAHRTWVAMNK